ncbi:MAG: metallophosphoesterase family protein [Acidobacteria bacterium]|nr:metallophosphoesterase family protein [Acidobacteriota bacterium]
MRFLILSDIHSNIDALDAVLARTPPESYDKLIVLGDLVGYGGTPNEVVERIFELEPDVMIRGNHDKVASGVESSDKFNRVAGEAARWTHDELTPANRERLAALPAGPISVDRDVEVCHGTPFDEDTYVFDGDDALKALEAASRPVCFFGHTHVPVAYALKGSELTVTHLTPGGDDTKIVNILKKNRYLINPGSIGQPRDTDARASYATYDSTKQQVQIKRVPYRIDLAQQRITEGGLPDSLAFRLGLGR